MFMFGFNSLYIQARLKASFLLTLGACFLTLPLSEAYADEGLYAKLFLGLNFATDQDFEVPDTSIISEGEGSFDIGSLAGVALGFRLTPSWAVELDYQYRDNDIDSISNQAGVFVDGGDLASEAILANLIYYPINTAVVDVYLGLGVGFLREIDANLSLVGSRSIDELGDSSNAAWQAMLGGKLGLVAGFSALVEARYLSGPGPQLSNELGAVELDYNNLSFAIGLNYDF